MAKEIEIAPGLDEITIDDEKIHTDWNGGITYSGPIGQLRKIFQDSWIIKQFQTAIAMTSKYWQAERLLNDYFKIEGKIS